MTADKRRFRQKVPRLERAIDAGVKKNGQGVETGIEQMCIWGRRRRTAISYIYTSSDWNNREPARFMPFPFRNCGGAQVSGCAKKMIQREFYP
ncbi:hypothetical protein C9413_17455 [Rhizobium sp. SEMIA 4085]|uniref:hypothetical protein n=1 Tax=Rhizobium TaxID=379 RepID=UPI00106416F5|nr:MULTISPECIES: hypothetical protein [Rhizobium]NNH31227.1 hypothetical protein [Rhizobium sp. SEMIA 4085]